MTAVFLPSSFLFLRISNGNCALAGPEQRRSNTAKRSSKQEKPLVPIAIVAVQTGCIGSVERRSDKQGPFRGDLVGNTTSKKTADGHESERQGIGSIVQVRLAFVSDTCAELDFTSAAITATHFGISPSSQIVQGRPNPRLAKGDQSNDDYLEQTGPVEPGYILEGHGRAIADPNSN